MALIAVTQKAKFNLLVKKLKVPRYAALGILESLWHFAHYNAPAGDIGRHSDETIAASIDWEGDPLELIEALILSRWVDRSRAHRLIVHDWKEHCSDATKLAVKRQRLTWAQDAYEDEQPVNGSSKGNEECRDTVGTTSGHCSDTVAKTATPWRLPAPAPAPVPEPEPGAEPAPDARGASPSAILAMLHAVPRFRAVDVDPGALERLIRDFESKFGDGLMRRIATACEVARGPTTGRVQNDPVIFLRRQLELSQGETKHEGHGKTKRNEPLADKKRRLHADVVERLRGSG